MDTFVVSPMLYLPTSTDALGGWCTENLFNLDVDGDFDVLEYAKTPQVSPLNCIHTYLNDCDEIEDQEPRRKSARTKETVPEHLANKRLPRHRRQSHVRAEKKRRIKIQEVLMTLHGYIPSLKPVENSRNLSEMDTLHAAGSYIREAQASLEARKYELERLRDEKKKLNMELHQFQDALPTAGLQRNEKRKISLEDRYQQYTVKLISQDWKFAFFDALVGRNLMEGYNQNPGKQTSAAGYIRSLMTWTRDNMCLTYLRPVIISSLRDVGKRTNFLARPELIRQEITNYSVSQGTTSSSATATSSSEDATTLNDDDAEAVNKPTSPGATNTVRRGFMQDTSSVPGRSKLRECIPIHAMLVSENWRVDQNMFGVDVSPTAYLRTSSSPLVSGEKTSIKGVGCSTIGDHKPSSASSTTATSTGSEHSQNQISQIPYT